MLYKIEGLPEEDEILLCKVTRILPNSVFVEMLEYNDSGMIHISEIAPGRIRNLRDHVSVGRQVVCKVLRIHRDRGHIDLSLRRVNSHQRREKLDEIKQELKAESLIKAVAKRLNKPVLEIYKQLEQSIFNEYSHLYLCFQEVATDETDLEKLGVPKQLAEELTSSIKDKFKPQKIKIQGEITFKTYATDGVGDIKLALSEIKKISDTITLFYLGAGRFKMIIVDEDYKPAEKHLKLTLKILEKFTDKLATATFDREKSE